MKSFLANWKTTAAGIAVILPALADILNIAVGKVGSGSLTMDVTTIAGGLGLLFAKDGNVTGGSVKQ